jgi:crotonobetaine/carnitine-CoA ligase
MLDFVLAQPESENDRDNPLRVVWTVPYVPERVKAFSRRFGIEHVVTSYGSTEVGMVARRHSLADGREGSAGKVDDSLYEVMVADESGEAVPDGSVGELLVRPCLPWTTFLGYVGRAEDTARALRDLWFHTGDLVRFDSQGSLWFVDRLDDRIRRRGENIASADVEAVLVSHPHIDEASVIAVPATEPGGEDEIKAVLIGRASAHEVWAWCDARLPYFAVPRYLEFVDSLPRTPTQKIRKSELRAAGITATTLDRGPIRSTGRRSE